MLFLHIILTLAFTKVLTHFSTDCFVILSHHVIRNAGGKCSWKQNYDKSLSNIIREPQGKMKYCLLYVPLIICVRQLTSTLLYAPSGKVWRAWNNWIMNSSHGQCAKLKNCPFYGINFVPIKMNVIFQETYENINWNGIKCLWNWKK